MSNKLSEAICDYVSDNKEAIAREYVETDVNYAVFTKWLFSEERIAILEALLGEFVRLESKEKEIFLDWAEKKAEKVLDAGEE